MHFVNNTWTSIPRHYNKKIIGSKWVYRVKKLVNGLIEKLKSLVLVKGYDQILGFDFLKILSTVVQFSTLKVVLTLALCFGQVLKKIDVNNDFLNRLLEEVVYMEQPEGF